MATCPKCHGDMPPMAPVCPHCGYDFPLQSPPEPRRRGLAYSGLGDLALVLGALFTALGALATLAVFVLSLIGREWARAISAFPTFFILLALYVVFQRTADKG